MRLKSHYFILILILSILFILNIILSKNNFILCASKSKNTGQDSVIFEKSELEILSETVQNQIWDLQNPEDCSEAPKVICSLRPTCGFGCQIHRVCYCLMVAYKLNRTLVMNWRRWGYRNKYKHKNWDWDDLFQPLSSSCRSGWKSYIGENSTILIHPYSREVVPGYPDSIKNRLEKSHSNPEAWWVGQFIEYLMRPSPETRKKYEEFQNSIGFVKPIVGVHVRRTDKIAEASFHPLSEYMAIAEIYYFLRGGTKKRAFITSDEPRVIARAFGEKYTQRNWEILADSRHAKVANSLRERFEAENLFAVINDVLLLSDCDFVVCTFSSNLCRLAYELMLAKRKDDASDRFSSLDVEWFQFESKKYYFMDDPDH